MERHQGERKQRSPRDRMLPGVRGGGTTGEDVRSSPSDTASPSPSPSARVCHQQRIMQSPRKSSAVSLARPPTCSGIQDWADIPDGLLHSIVARMGSFRDILGFAATCPSWRAAYSSYPSKSMFRIKFPPLLIQPHVRVQGPRLPSTEGCCELLTCEVIDPANPNTALHCQIPYGTLEKMTCIGSSYGNLIYYRDGYCRIVDVFTGVEVSAPRLPPSAKCQIYYFDGILTAPVASPDSHLLVRTRSYLFDWRVGSDSWSQVQLPYMLSTDQIVEYNGQFIHSNGNGSFHSVQLAPQLGLQKITTNKQDWSQEDRDFTWVVVCGDMLIVLIPLAYELYRLDLSTKPATVMTMEKLDNWALFFGEEGKSAPLSCMSPEQWGGRSNTSYHARGYSEPCTFHGLCDEPDTVSDPPSVQPAWLPSGCSLEPWGRGSNLLHAASLDSDPWNSLDSRVSQEPRGGTSTITHIAALHSDAWNSSDSRVSQESWGLTSTITSIAALHSDAWNSSDSRVSQESWGLTSRITRIANLESDPWDPPRWDNELYPVQDTPFGEGSAPARPALPLWLYPSMFYSVSGE